MWRKNYFVEFNSWVQVSKTVQIVEYTENKVLDDDHLERISGYSCHLKLKFHPQKHGKISDFVANGYGKNKKVAKLMATENLIADLI